MEKLLKTHFGYDSFRPLQKEIIDTVLSGKDSFVLMPTGGGKSLCFQLPALMLPGITLVVSPLIALMKDQVDALMANGISAAFINSSLSQKEQADVMKRSRSGEIKILYLAPERVSSYGFSEFLEDLEVSLLAIDEAHCISEWGHDFRPDYRNLRSLRQRVSKAPVIALTATATPIVREDILSQLGIKKGEIFVSSFNRENLTYSVQPKYETFHELTKLLKSRKGESIIVYCFSRKNTEDTAKKLNKAGLKAAAYHAGLPKKARVRVQDQFIRDEVPIIVATIAFGMGIDKPDVRLVVHMDLPKTIESYYQETGRAGRDGLPSDCILFYSYGDRRKQEYFINHLDDEDERKVALRKLDDVVEYCQNEVCRRFFLLVYFGEMDAATSCDACDNCTLPPAEESDATEISQMILSAIIRTGERFGAAHVCDVLHGSKKKRLLELGHDKLSVHGIARNVDTGALREYTHALRKRGYLDLSPGEYPTLSVSSKGRRALTDKEAINLPVTKTVEKLPTRASKTSSDLEYDVATFEKLRAVRKRIADEKNVPPFVIFGDRTLHQMAYYFPSSEEAFSHLFGVGKQKQEEYAKEFLECIAEHARENKLEEKPVPVKVQSRRATEKTAKTSSTLEETKMLIEKKMSLMQIADERRLSKGTIIQHLEKLVNAGELDEIEHLRPNKQDFDVMAKAFEASGGTSITAVYHQLGEKYRYDELRLVRLFL